MVCSAAMIQHSFVSLAPALSPLPLLAHHTPVTKAGVGSLATLDIHKLATRIIITHRPHYISLSHIPHLTPSHTTPLTPHTPHSFVWRSNREQDVTREKQLPQKLHRLLPMATTKKQQDLRRRPHILPGGLRKNLTPSHKQ